MTRHARMCGRLTFSFIRTMTVGPGIAPDLLTPPRGGGDRGLAAEAAYRR
jgi:hypothetical protein